MNFIIVLGFANQRVAERTLKNYADTRTSDAKLLIVDNHYPLNVTSDFWRRAAADLGGTYLDPGKNLGLHEGLNFALREARATENDRVLIMDPDTYPFTPGWDTALLEALDIPGVGWASLCNNHSDGEMRERGYDETIEGGLKIWTTHRPVVNSVSGFRLDWVLAAGGFQEPYAYYGGLEVAMWEIMKKNTNYRWVFLRDFFEDVFKEDLIDPIYIAYKYAHGHQGYQGDFETYLKEHGA